MENFTNLDVFISYSSADEEEAEKIKKSLERSPRNLNCWKANCVNISTGEYFKEKIISAIEKAKVVLFVLSKNSLQSNWVAMELNVAIFENKKIFPILVDDTPLNKLYQFKLGCSQFLNATENFDAAIESVAINAKLACDANIEKTRKELLSKVIFKPFKYIFLDFASEFLFLIAFVLFLTIFITLKSYDMTFIEYLSQESANNPIGYLLNFIIAEIIIIPTYVVLLILKLILSSSLKKGLEVFNPSALYVNYRIVKTKILLFKLRKKRSFYYLEKSADLGNQNAIKQIVKMYEKGIWVDKNLKKAEQYRLMLS